MTRAETAALKAYPDSTRDEFGILTFLGYAKRHRECFIEGYKQSEKDLALTWEDIKKIDRLSMEVTTLFASVGRNKDILERPFYEEIARRFNEQRKK